MHGLVGWPWTYIFRGLPIGAIRRPFNFLSTAIPPARRFTVGRPAVPPRTPPYVGLLRVSHGFSKPARDEQALENSFE